MILAAGLGTRLRPLTDTMPKALVPVGGRPLLDIVIDKLAQQGFDRFVVNVHHFAQQIIDHVKSLEIPSVLISDETAPLELQRDNIRAIIVNHRKTALLGKLQADLLAEAAEGGHIKSSKKKEQN